MSRDLPSRRMIEESNMDYSFSQVVQQQQQSSLVTPPKKYLNARASTFRVGSFNPEGLKVMKMTPV